MITIGFPIGMTLGQMIYCAIKKDNYEFGAGWISASWIGYLAVVYL